jgi:hypothetical protein
MFTCNFIRCKYWEWKPVVFVPWRVAGGPLAMAQRPLQSWRRPAGCGQRDELRLQRRRRLRAGGGRRRSEVLQPTDPRPQGKQNFYHNFSCLFKNRFGEVFDLIRSSPISLRLLFSHRASYVFVADFGQIEND